MATVLTQISRRLARLSAKHMRLNLRAKTSSSVVSLCPRKKFATGAGLVVAGSIAFVLGQRYVKTNVVYAAKRKQREEELQKAVKLMMREKRFIKFASVKYDGQLFMTLRDFTDSMIDSEPRLRQNRRVLSDKELEVMKNSTPSLRHGSSHMFRDLGENGLISYAEYLFLLSIIMKPKTGFRTAFNMFDTDRNERVNKYEFLVIQKCLERSLKEMDESIAGVLRSLIAPNEETLAARAKLREANLVEENRSISNFRIENIFSHAWRGRHGMDTRTDLDNLSNTKTPEDDNGLQEFGEDQGLQRRSSVDTTLMIHFFGNDGTKEMRYEDFKRFIENLQHEILELEFNAYSHDRAFITEPDFASMLLRYAAINVDEYDEYLERMEDRLDQQLNISFDEFRVFYQFLNNLDDFAIAMRMYTLADRPISKGEFSRAVKICTGTVLSAHIIDTIFALFDVDGDGQLSYKEFIDIMKDRVHRGFKNQPRSGRWDAFRHCVKQEMKAP